MMQLPTVAFAATFLNTRAFYSNPKEEGTHWKIAEGNYGLLTWVLLDKHRIESKISAACTHAYDVYFQY